MADLRFVHADGTPYGQRPDAQQVGVMTQAFGALRNMGFRETETKRALARIPSHGGLRRNLEEVLRDALRVLTAGVS